MKKSLLAMILTMLSAPVLAAGWGTPVQIEGYYIWDAGVAYIKTSTHLNPESCQSSQYLSIDSASPNFKYIWSQVVAAQASGQTVSLFYDGCLGPYPKIRAIAIPNVW